MEELEALVTSPEFAAVKAALDALDPNLLTAPNVGPHVQAMRLGTRNLAKIDFSPAEDVAPEGAPEPEPSA